MKKFILILLTCSVHFSYSQKNDNVWLLGYHYYPGFLPALDFYFGYPDTIVWNSPLDFFGGADASICNDNGDMLFYTDGSTMCNYLNDTMQNSIHFNYDSALVALYGNVDLPKQSVIILPFPDHPGQYYVFHIFGHLWNNNQTLQPVRLAASVVDMNANGGSGTMTVKDQTIVSDTLLYGTLQAVKHANGRDWWVVIHRWKSKTFYKCLLTPSGVSSILTQNAGPRINTGMYYYNGQTVFSPDGSHYAIAHSDSNKVSIFDFDRCTGDFTFRKKIDFSTFSSLPNVNGCSFSPNSRFLYVTSSYDLYQFDMDASNITASMIHIATWDGSGGFNPYYFEFHRLGPDGKIYITTPPSFYIHMINDPDQLDTLCNFTQHSLKLKSYHSGYLPEFPSYRLGALSGSLCDSLTSVNDLSQTLNEQLQIFPNPNNGEFMVSYHLSPNTEGKLKVVNLLGEKVFEKKLPQWSAQQHINLPHLIDGIYEIVIEHNGNSFFSIFIKSEH